MTSGIYKLTFPSGNFYIGKSVDIEKRWKQHSDSLNKGKHTKLLQNEFNLYNRYHAEIVFTCHIDHIDIAEETFISRLRPTLNGTLPADRLHGYYNELFDVICSYFDRSTVEHILEIEARKDQVRLLEDYKDAATGYIAHLEGEACQLLSAKALLEKTALELSRSQAAQRQQEHTMSKLIKTRDAEELEADILGRVSTLQERLNQSESNSARLENECNRLSKEAHQLFLYKSLPWYKKIFN